MSRIFLFTFLYFFSTVLNAQYEVYDTDLFLNQASEFVNNEKYDAAIKAYNNIHEEDPQYVDAQFEIFLLNHHLEKYEKAESVLESLYKKGKFKDDPKLYASYGAIFSIQDKLDESLKIYTEAEKIIPRYAPLNYNIAIIHRKKNELNKAIKYAKKAVLYNPNYNQAHYLISQLAFDSGNLSLGSLAAIACLSTDPTGSMAFNAITLLNKKMGSNYLEEADLEFSEKGDDFSNLDFILRGEFPLDKKYKLNCEIDDILPRHIQAIVEYAAQHEIKDGFFENIYISYLKDIHQKGQTENFLYWTLSGLTGDIEKTLSKKKKQLSDFYDNYYAKDYWNEFSKRKIDHLGEEKEVNIFMSNGSPYFYCQTIDGKFEGTGVYLDNYYRLNGKVPYKENIASGEAKYYDIEGNVTEDRIYQNDIRNGVNNFYNKEGKVVTKYNYKDDKLDGKVQSFHKDGSDKCTLNYKDGLLHGNYTCNYTNGVKEVELKYANGEVNGDRIKYSVEGKIISKEIYKDNFYNGTCTYYDTFGKNPYTIVYKEGEIAESYSLKDIAGKISYEYIKDGDKVITKNYENGHLSTTSNYVKNDIIKTEYYENDKLSYGHYYKDDKLTAIKQFSNKYPKGKKLDLRKHKLYSSKNRVVSEREFSNGKINGLNKYYYPNENIKSEINYKAGKEDGTSTFYDFDGRVTSKYNIKNDSLQGKYTTYTKSYKNTEYFYKDDMLNGPNTSYYESGEIRSKGFYLDGKIYGREYFFTKDGKVYVEYEHKFGKVVKKKRISESGNTDTEIDYTTDGLKVYNPSELLEKSTFNLKNGFIEGPYLKLASNGDTIWINDYLGGKSHGVQRYFHPTGNISFAAKAFQNSYEGIGYYYDHLGKLFAETYFANNKENGKEIYYFANGKIKYEQSSLKDELHGEKVIYNMEGVVLATLTYENGLIVKYKMIGQSEERDLDVSEKVLTGSYPNGNKAIIFSVSKMIRNGKFSIWNEAGKPVYEFNYTKGVSNGASNQYHANGKLYQSTTFKNGQRHGVTSYFDENGVLLIKYNSKFGDYQGEYQIYKDGEIIKTKVYNNDELTKIK